MSITVTAITDLDKEIYSCEQVWYDFYKNNNSLASIPINPDWTIMFAQLKNNPKFNKTNERLKKRIKKNKHLKIYPFPRYIFKAFTMTSPSDLKVVIIGQDPYYKSSYYNGKYVPQAMGLSFSVPHDIPIPSSLDNIYENMLRFGHIKEKPTTGNLWYWAVQGCLMLNAALTVEDEAKKSHSRLWEWFTDYVIQFISDHFDNIIFAIWGGDAYKKINKIDLDRHHVTISSHPSGLSANKPFRNYPPFLKCDHFGRINEILERTKRKKILWQ